MFKHWLNWTIKLLKNQDGNLKKMFTPPKSKSPWEAMTAGSTGGWAKGLQPFGTPITMALGAVPGVGPALSAGAGLMGMTGSGFQGTDKGWGNAGSMLLGGLTGYGAGAVGSGIRGAAKGLLQGGMSAVPTNMAQMTGGFQKGLSSFLGTPIIPGMARTSGTAIGKGISGLISKGGGLLGLGRQGGAPGQAGYMPRAEEDASNLSNIFNLGNIVRQTLGAGLLGVSTAMKPPTISTKPGAAREAIYSPNLVQARDMIKTMAMANPNEFANSAELQEYIDNTKAQAEIAYKDQRRIIENNLAAKGKTIDKSGGGSKVLADFDAKYAAGVRDFIADTRWAAYVAGINRQVKAVASYFNVAEQEAADILAANGYISPQDLINYNAALQNYTGAQQALGTAGGNLLAPQYANV